MSGVEGLVEREDRYLIRKQGAWYRPNGGGYTGSAIQAGRFTLDEAEMHTHPNGRDGPRDGMDYVHEDDVADPDWRAYFALQSQLAAREAEVARLRGALRTYAGPIGGTAFPHWAGGYPGGVFVAENVLDYGEAARATLGDEHHD